MSVIDKVEGAIEGVMKTIIIIALFTLLALILLLTFLGKV